jgi:AraC-like DNA-binding protein
VTPLTAGSNASERHGRFHGERDLRGRRRQRVDGAAGADTHHVKPLRSYSRYCTSDPAQAVTELTRMLAPHEMVLSDPVSGFSAEGRMAEFDDVLLGYMIYCQDVTFYCPPDQTFVYVTLPIRNGISIGLEKADAVYIPTGSAFVVPTDTKITMNWPDDTEFMVIRVRAAALQHFLHKLAPEVRNRSLRFDGAIADKVAGAALGGLAQLIASICERYESVESVPRVLRNELCDQVLSSMLMSLHHSHTDAIFKVGFPAATRTVRLAMEMMADEAQSECTVSDIASALGVSLRTLELGFRRELDCTPRTYLQTVRLNRAHDELRASTPDDGATVTEIAMRCGFGHTGRFAAEYRKVFGESPSAALRSRN